MRTSWWKSFSESLLVESLFEPLSEPLGELLSCWRASSPELLRLWEPSLTRPKPELGFQDDPAWGRLRFVWSLRCKIHPQTIHANHPRKAPRQSTYRKASTAKPEFSTALIFVAFSPEIQFDRSAIRSDSSVRQSVQQFRSTVRIDRSVRQFGPTTQFDNSNRRLDSPMDRRTPDDRFNWIELISAPPKIELLLATSSHSKWPSVMCCSVAHRFPCFLLFSKFSSIQIDRFLDDFNLKFLNCCNSFQLQMFSLQMFSFQMFSTGQLPAIASLKSLNIVKLTRVCESLFGVS